MVTAVQRREALDRLRAQASGCLRCPALVAARHTVVFGSGNPDADLMFVGEIPGRGEDHGADPWAGRAGELLRALLERVGLAPDDVFLTHTLKCRPPQNRDPLPQEVANCRPYLHEQLGLVRPKVLCTLGNGPTKLLRGDPAGVSTLHGVPEVRVVGSHPVRLVPLLHPSAALYTPRMGELLRDDIARLPELLALPRPVPDAGTATGGPPGKAEPERAPARAPEPREPAPIRETVEEAAADVLERPRGTAVEGVPGQLGLFG